MFCQLKWHKKTKTTLTRAEREKMIKKVNAKRMREAKRRVQKERKEPGKEIDREEQKEVGV